MKNSILTVIDGSYFLYYVIFGAVRKYEELYRLEAKTMIKSAEETDQSNLPDLLVSDAFRSVLKKNLIERCETVDWILKQNFQDEIDLAEHIDILFVQDDSASKSFRKSIFPEYKAQRKLVKKSYDLFKIKQYIMDVLFPELNIVKQFNYHTVFVNGAEGDDIVACTMKNFNDYMLKVLIASDHDFQQIEGIHQFDLRGSEIKTKIKIKKEDVFLNPNEALLLKILTGDGSDNIPSICERMGNVTAYKYIQNKDQLKQLLIENQDAAKQFKVNKSIIDFNQIPNDLSKHIIEEVGKILSNIDNENKEDDINIPLMDL